MVVSASKRKLTETTIDLVSRGDRTPAQFRPGQQHTFCTGLNTKHASTTTNSAKKRCVWRQVKVATLNTRAKLTRGRLFELEEGCKSYKINIVGVQKHLRQTIDSIRLEETEQGDLFIYSTANERCQEGVGLFLDRVAKSQLKTYEKVTDRIIYALLDSNLSILVVFAYSRLDFVPNEDILATVGRRPLINSVRRRQLGWLGHVLRRDEKEPARIFALYSPERERAIRGQPPKTYLKQRGVASLQTPGRDNARKRHRSRQQQDRI